MSEGGLGGGAARAAEITLHEALRERRSARRYRSESVADAVLERLFVSAALAPSGHNRQPWRFAVVREPEQKAALARAMGSRLAEDRRRDGDAADAIARDVARSLARITGAPVVVLVCTTMAEMDRYNDSQRGQAEFLMAVQSTAMATQNLLLAAHAEGLGACWMCAPLFCPAIVRTTLRLADDWHPQGLITLGWPAETGVMKPRKPLAEFVRMLEPALPEDAGAP